MPCGYKISVDGHNMLVVNTDGRPVVPFEVEALFVFSGAISNYRPPKNALPAILFVGDV